MAQDIYSQNLNCLCDHPFSSYKSRRDRPTNGRTECNA